MATMDKFISGFLTVILSSGIIALVLWAFYVIIDMLPYVTRGMLVVMGLILLFVVACLGGLIGVWVL